MGGGPDARRNGGASFAALNALNGSWGYSPLPNERAVTAREVEPHPVGQARMQPGRSVRYRCSLTHRCAHRSDDRRHERRRLDIASQLPSMLDAPFVQQGLASGPRASAGPARETPGSRQASISLLLACGSYSNALGLRIIQ